MVSRIENPISSSFGGLELTVLHLRLDTSYLWVLQACEATKVKDELMMEFIPDDGRVVTDEAQIGFYAVRHALDTGLSYLR